MGKAFNLALEAKAWRLLGAFWKTHWEVYFDTSNGDFVIRYI